MPSRTNTSRLYAELASSDLPIAVSAASVLLVDVSQRAIRLAWELGKQDPESSKQLIAYAGECHEYTKQLNKGEKSWEFWELIKKIRTHIRWLDVLMETIALPHPKDPTAIIVKSIPGIESPALDIAKIIRELGEIKLELSSKMPSLFGSIGMRLSGIDKNDELIQLAIRALSIIWTLEGRYHELDFICASLSVTTDFLERKSKKTNTLVDNNTLGKREESYL